MQLYLAPMEGLTGYVYRNAYEKNYGGIDKYFTPFLTNKKMSSRELNDILPEHNEGMQVVPQILTNRAEDFLAIAKELQTYGYQTVNLNLGCPSGTVVAKNRGAGFLALPEELDCFLEEIFAKCPIGISIKTRIGKESPKEWERLLSIYEKYPLEELIVHPRVQREFYKGSVHMDAFALATEHSRHALCYNGDICTADDYRRVTECFPDIQSVMIGRGILKNPGLVGSIRAEFNDAAKGVQTEKYSQAKTVVPTDDTLRKERLRAFHDDILTGYRAVMSGDKNTLFKMKELWVYLAEQFVEPDKYIKKIRKSERVRDYEVIVSNLFRECDLQR